MSPRRCVRGRKCAYLRCLTASPPGARLERDFFRLGRLRASFATVKEAKFSSKAYGTRESKEIVIAGRVIFDMLQAIQREAWAAKSMTG